MRSDVTILYAPLSPWVQSTSTMGRADGEDRRGGDRLRRGRDAQAQVVEEEILLRRVGRDRTSLPSGVAVARAVLRGRKDSQDPPDVRGVPKHGGRSAEGAGMKSLRIWRVPGI